MYRQKRYMLKYINKLKKFFIKVGEFMFKSEIRGVSFLLLSIIGLIIEWDFIGGLMLGVFLTINTKTICNLFNYK